MSSRSSHARRVHPRRAAAWLLTVAAANVEGAVHGTVVIGLLFAAEDAQDVGYPETIGAAMLVLALFWLTEIYAHDVGERLQEREPVNLRHVGRSFVHEFSIVEGGFIPVLVLLVAWAAGASVTDGVTAAIWVTVATIIALEVVASWRAGLRPKPFWLRACAGMAMGLAIVVLKLMLH